MDWGVVLVIALGMILAATFATRKEPGCPPSSETTKPSGTTDAT